MNQKRLLILADCIYNAVVEENYEKAKGIAETIVEVCDNE